MKIYNIAFSLNTRRFNLVVSALISNYVTFRFDDVICHFTLSADDFAPKQDLKSQRTNLCDNAGCTSLALERKKIRIVRFLRTCRDLNLESVVSVHFEAYSTYAPNIAICIVDKSLSLCRVSFRNVYFCGMSE